MRLPSEWRHGDFPRGIEVRQESGWDYNYAVYRYSRRLAQFADYTAAAEFAFEQYDPADECC